MAEGVDIAALQRRTCGADAHEDHNSGHAVAHTQSAATPITVALATAKSMDVLTASDSDSDSPPATPPPRGSLQRRRSCAGAGANASAASSAASALGAVAAVAVFATRARRASCAATPSRDTCAAPAAAAQEQGEAPSKVSHRRSSLEWAAAAAATTVVAAGTGMKVQEEAPLIRIRRRSTAGTQPAAIAAVVAATMQGAAPAIRIRRRSSCAGTQPAAVAAEVAAATAVAVAAATAAAAAAEEAAAEAAAAEVATAEAMAAAALPLPTVSFKPHRPTAEIFLDAMVGTSSAPPPALRSSWEAPADDSTPGQAEPELGEAEAAASGTGLTRGGGAAPSRRRRSVYLCGATAASHGPAKQGSHSAMLLRRNAHDEEAAPAAFKRFDTDGDGTISKAEFSALLTCPSASNPPLTPDEVERLFAKLDLDGNGSIDLREFGQAWAESSGDLAALVPMTAEMQVAQEAAAQAAAAEQAAAEQAAAQEAATQEAEAQETARRNAKTSRYLRRSSTVAAFPSTVARDAVAAAAAAGAAIADAAAADAAAKSSAAFPASKTARRRAKSTANLRPSPLLLGDDKGSDDADEGTGLHQIDLTALTETNDTGASETATSGAAFGAAADGASPPQGANLSPLSPPRSRLLSLRTSASERASGVSGGGHVLSSARTLASKAKAYEVATTVEEMLAVQTLGSPRQGAPSPVRRDSTPTSPASATSSPPKWRRCSGSSGPRPGSSGSRRPGTPTSPLSSPPKWQRPSGSPGASRAGQQSPSSPRQSPSPLVQQDRSGPATPLLTRSYHVQPRYHGPPQPGSSSLLVPRHEKSYPRSASVQDMGRHRLRYQPKDVAWERMTRTNGATPTVRLLPQVEVRPAFASLDALAHENGVGEPPQPLLAQLLQQVDSHVDGSYEHWFLPRKYTTTPAALVSWRDGR